MVTNRSIEIGGCRIGYKFKLELGELVDRIGLENYQSRVLEYLGHNSTKFGVSDRQRSLLLIFNRLQQTRQLRRDLSFNQGRSLLQSFAS